MTTMTAPSMATGRLSAALGASSTGKFPAQVQRALGALIPPSVRLCRSSPSASDRSGAVTQVTQLVGVNLRPVRASALWIGNRPVTTIDSPKRPTGCRTGGSAPGSVAMSISTEREVEVNDDLFSDYKCNTAFLFPGQGAQAVGMGSTAQATSAAAALFEKANDILGYNLLDICLNGPAEKLNSTVISQPAIYVASLAAVEALRTSEDGHTILNSCDVACGLSLGEYTALSFAGAISFEDGLRLVKLRGESMQAAADAAPTAMVSVIGLDKEKVRELCETATEEAGHGEQVQIGNYLCPGNYAVSGSVKACEVVEKRAKAFGARMTVRLAVAGAFHTSYMAPAVEKLREALSSTTINVPRIPVISNVDARPHADPDVIRKILAQQVTSPVQWETTLSTLLERGMKQSYELGPGKVIAGILKRIDRKLPVTNVSV